MCGSRPGCTYRSPIASCMSFAATVLSTPPLTAPMTRPVGPQISRMRKISFPMNSFYKKFRKGLMQHERVPYHRPVLCASTDVNDKSGDDFLAAF